MMAWSRRVVTLLAHVHQRKGNMRKAMRGDLVISAPAVARRVMRTGGHSESGLRVGLARGHGGVHPIYRLSSIRAYGLLSSCRQVPAVILCQAARTADEFAPAQTNLLRNILYQCRKS